MNYLWIWPTALLALLLSGCQLLQPMQPVQAWQRGVLAKPEMSGDVSPLISSVRQHTQFSKEAASGGTSLGGGGCGCN